MKELIKRISSYNNIIWDWNGTLLDDYDVIKKAISYQLKEHGLPIPTDEELKEMFCFPIREYYRRLGFRLDQAQFAQLAKNYLNAYQELVVSESSLHNGTEAILHALSSVGKKQFILSAAEQNYLREQVAFYRIDNFFEKIVGLSNIYGDSKVDLGKSLMKEQQLIRKETILIGDTDHDYEVACALGIECLLIAGGSQSYGKLKKTHYNVLQHRS
jgi:phosphoglycolate phosphatase